MGIENSLVSHAHKVLIHRGRVHMPLACPLGEGRRIVTRAELPEGFKHLPQRIGHWDQMGISVLHAGTRDDPKVLGGVPLLPSHPRERTCPRKVMKATFKAQSHQTHSPGCPPDPERTGELFPQQGWVAWVCACPRAPAAKGRVLVAAPSTPDRWRGQRPSAAPSGTPSLEQVPLLPPGGSNP